MKGGWTRWFFYTHILVIPLLMSTGLCDSICGQLCHPVGSVPGWNTDCFISREDCRFIEDTGQPPSAPLNLRILNNVNRISDTTALLAMSITWELPENASGLTGFVIRVLKTSYPVSSLEDCRKITFGNAASIPDTLKVNFSASCWNDVDVDSKYRIKVQSLNSGQSSSSEHHTSKCLDVPEVSGCLIGCQESPCSIDPPDNWIPRNKPTTIVYNDQVTVSFNVYPGDFWLTYRINLYNQDLNRTEIFHRVNTNGSSGRFDYTFYSVDPGSYEARVQIDTGDPYQVRSDPFQVLPVVKATPPPPPTTTPIHVAISIPQEQDPGSSPMPQSGIKEILTYIGVGIGVIAAVGILFGLIMWKRRKQKLMGGSSGTGGGSSTSTPDSSPPCSDTSPVVNNMAYNNVVKLPHEGQYGQTRNDLGQSSWSEDEQSKMQAYGDPYQQGSIYTDYSECYHTVKGIDRNILDDEPESCVSRSGIVM